MSAHQLLQGPHPRTTTRQATAHLRRIGAALAALICALLASAAVIPAAWAVNVAPSEGGPGVPVQAPAVPVVTPGGMAGWQITLIALGAAAVAATAAVLLDRARAARQTTAATAR